MIVWLSWFVGGVIVVAGAALAARALFWDRARGRQRCPGGFFAPCWYDMRGSDGRRCPECGRQWRSDRQLARTRRYWGRAAFGVLLMVAGFSVAVWHEMTGGRWRHWVPDTVLIVALPHTDEIWLLDELQRRIDGAPQPSQIQWVRREALWEWQWRWLADRCGRVALSSEVAGNRETAVSLLLHKCPDVSPAVDSLAELLADPTHDQRGLVAWGLKASRHFLDSEAHATVLEAIQSAPAPNPSARNARGGDFFSDSAPIAISALSAQPPATYLVDVRRTRTGLSPEMVESRAAGAMVAQLALLQRELGIPSRCFTWTVDGESGPIAVQRFDLEIDGRPGLDCVLRLSPETGFGQQMIVFLRRGAAWLYIGYFDIIQMITGLSEPTTMTDPSGRIWLRTRTELGTGITGTYALCGESWLTVRGDRLEIGLIDTVTDGYARNTDRWPTQSTIQWSFTSSEPRCFEEGGELLVEYELECAFESGWSAAWDTADSAAIATRDQPLFTRVDTIRYRWDRSARRFVPAAGGTAATWQALFTLWNAPDALLEANRDEFIQIARGEDRGKRSWLRLFLTSCAPSESRDAVQAALDEADTLP